MKKSEIREKVKALMSDSDLVGLTEWIFILRAELTIKDKALGLACKELDEGENLPCPMELDFVCPPSKQDCTLLESQAHCWRDHFINKARESSK